MKPEDKDVHVPLSRAAFDSIVYNAVGRGSEINTLPAFALSHSTGNSGWSTGIVQWDFGQPGRGHKVAELLAGYQAWAAPGSRFSEDELDALSRRLQRRGQTGNALESGERDRLDAFLRSGSGREFVDGLNREQVDYKWRRIGQPLAAIPWLEQLGRDNPAQATEIVAMASKLFNQNEVRGARLLGHLQHNELSADGTAAWIGTTGIDGLNTRAQSAILTGCDNARAGARLLGELQYGTSRTSDRWRSIVERGDSSLSEGFDFNPDLQLFDAMLRSPRDGLRLLRQIEGTGPNSAITIRGFNTSARMEMAEVRALPPDGLFVTTTRGTEYALRDANWSLAKPLADRRDGDGLDYTEGLRLRLHASSRPGNVDSRGIDSMKARVRDLYETHGATASPSELDKISAALIREASRSGAGEITRIAFAESGQLQSRRLIAWHGSPADPATRWTTLSVQDALVTRENTPGPLGADLHRLASDRLGPRLHGVPHEAHGLSQPQPR